MVRKVIWDGVNAHVVLVGADEGEVEFPEMEDRIGNTDDESMEEDNLEVFADVNYEDEMKAAASKSPWGEGSK